MKYSPYRGSACLQISSSIIEADELMQLFECVRSPSNFWFMNKLIRDVNARDFFSKHSTKIHLL